MLTRFIKYLQQHVPLNEQDIDFLYKVLSVKSFKKGTILLSEGQISTAFYFNLTGFVRLFYLKNGEERTAFFYPQNTFISAYESFVHQTPSRLNLQATEQTTLVEISVTAATQLLQYSPKFEALARIAMEDELITHQKIIATLLTLTPEERYYNLLDENPLIFQKVPQHYIASYIGVKPESLSRIKKRHFEQNT